jgi:hypothetical protein
MKARGATPVLRSSGVVRQRDVPVAAGVPAGVGVVAVGTGAVELAVPAGVADDGELDATAPAELVDPPVGVVAVAPRAPLAAPDCGAGEGAGAAPPTAPDEHAANAPTTAVRSEA